MRPAFCTWDSAMSTETPRALTARTASMNRVTTTGASPSNGSSSSSTAGFSVSARLMQAAPREECLDLGEDREDLIVGGDGRLVADPTGDLEVLLDGEVGEDP